MSVHTLLEDVAVGMFLALTTRRGLSGPEGKVPLCAGSSPSPPLVGQLLARSECYGHLFTRSLT